jgi:SET domain-containing protein
MLAKPLAEMGRRFFYFHTFAVMTSDQITRMKGKLINELQHQTYVMLQPSPVHGIGVFAIRDIPKGTRNMFSTGIGEWIKIPAGEVDALPEHSRKLVETYCLYDEENYFIPDYGFKVMDLVLYLNHSDTPNIISINEGEQFETVRDIKTGEELLVDYGTLVDPEL